tara:strand:+ start:360 stop:1001 length:642 start_codon:yes stop_codon:yes gene_type:complete
MKMEKQTQKRQVAYKVTINQIKEKPYVKEAGEWSPNFIQIEGKQVSRVNLLGVIIAVEQQQEGVRNNLLVDDGTGTIALRSFDEKDMFKGLAVGELVTIIGRPREYGGEKYIATEIVKKVSDPAWMNVRKKELVPITQKESPVKSLPPEQNEPGLDPNEKLFNLIREFDKGEGVDIEEVINQMQIPGTDKMIERLLAQGEVFEVKPGKLKILE